MAYEGLGGNFCYYESQNFLTSLRFRLNYGIRSHFDHPQIWLFSRTREMVLNFAHNFWPCQKIRAKISPGHTRSYPPHFWSLESVLNICLILAYWLQLTNLLNCWITAEFLLKFCLTRWIFAEFLLKHQANKQIISKVRGLWLVAAANL